MKLFITRLLDKLAHHPFLADTDAASQEKIDELHDYAEKDAKLTDDIWKAPTSFQSHNINYRLPYPYGNHLHITKRPPSTHASGMAIDIEAKTKDKLLPGETSDLMVWLEDHYRVMFPGSEPVVFWTFKGLNVSLKDSGASWTLPFEEVRRMKQIDDEKTETEKLRERLQAYYEVRFPGVGVRVQPIYTGFYVDRKYWPRISLNRKEAIALLEEADRPETDLVRGQLFDYYAEKYPTHWVTVRELPDEYKVLVGKHDSRPMQVFVRKDQVEELLKTPSKPNVWGHDHKRPVAFMNVNGTSWIDKGEEERRPNPPLIERVREFFELGTSTAVEVTFYSDGYWAVAFEEYGILRFPPQALDVFKLAEEYERHGRVRRGFFPPDHR